MTFANRVAVYLRRSRYDEPPLYVVIGNDRRRLIETTDWSEAKGFRDQWRDLGYPKPAILVVRK